jgi:hypothetical protein
LAVSGHLVTSRENSPEEQYFMFQNGATKQKKFHHKNEHLHFTTQRRATYIAMAGTTTGADGAMAEAARLLAMQGEEGTLQGEPLKYLLLQAPGGGGQVLMRHLRKGAEVVCRPLPRCGGQGARWRMQQLKQLGVTPQRSAGRRIQQRSQKQRERRARAAAAAAAFEEGLQQEEQLLGADQERVEGLRARAQVHVGEAPPCPHCGAELFEGEPRGRCCSDGEKVAELLRVPEVLEHFLFHADNAERNRILSRAYNTRLNLASFGVRDGGLTKHWGDAMQSIHGTTYHAVREPDHPYTSWYRYNPVEVDDTHLHVSVKGKRYHLSPHTLHNLRSMLLQTNPLVQQYKAVYGAHIGGGDGQVPATTSKVRPTIALQLHVV